MTSIESVLSGKSGKTTQSDKSSISQRRKSSKLVSHEEIPEALREPGIVSNYRSPGYSKTECVISIFQFHNETLNVWTHILAMVFFAYFLYKVTHELNVLHYNYHPLLCVLLTSCIYPLGSAVAHTFNCMSECSNHISFMIDYYCISLYAFGACIGNKTYAFPLEWRDTWLEGTFLIANFFNCVFALYLSCLSRFRTLDRLGKLYRIVGFSLPYIFGMAPCFYRVIKAKPSDLACIYYSYHFYDIVFIVFFYGSHFPERFFPGIFDLFLHSHQIFHVLAALGTYHKVTGLLEDIRNDYEMSPSPDCIKLLLILATVNGLIVLYFGKRMHDLHHPKNNFKGGDN